ncbi:probable protein phosphatase 2C 6 [Syzygium oleosum]|uniref:probable protein phosphatase 2C 6 n=1 Tax=Syzygium oleosum TaxID=219896 RepID=UPI0011D24786|nr:probable protein phosphatase 2C 6 [Syzygium oleosum]
MGSCCSTPGGQGRRVVGVAAEGDPTSATVAARGLGSGSARWKKIGSFSKRRSGNSDQLLNQSQIHVAGKMCVSGASDVACLYTQQGKKGTNQDAMVVWENYSSRSDTVFCGVFDGHGPLGHMVAKKVRDSLPLILCTQWTASSSVDESDLADSENAPCGTTNEEGAVVASEDQWSESWAIEEKERLPEALFPLRQSMLKSFNLMDKELKLHPTIDCFCSGTTAVTLIKQGQHLVIGNVGDSRAVLASRDIDNSLVPVQLTVDLKPDLPREAARIQKCKGRVFALQDEPEVARVWLPNNDSPGLAMARAFGDFCLKDFGLISVPDIYYRHLSEGDEFIIMATDGVWDVLSNKEAIDIVSSAPSRTTAARALVDCAVRAWRLKYPNSKTDDCAAVCLFLDHLSSREAWPTGDTAKNAEPPVVTVAVTADKSEALDLDSDCRDLEFERASARGTDEIVPVPEFSEEKVSGKLRGHSKRSLAECISTAEDEEWSALEGVTRVNSLLSLPRFLSGDARSASWRKWLPDF